MFVEDIRSWVLIRLLANSGKSLDFEQTKSVSSNGFVFDWNYSLVSDFSLHSISYSFSGFCSSALLAFAIQSYGSAGIGPALKRRGDWASVESTGRGSGGASLQTRCSCLALCSGDRIGGSPAQRVLEIWRRAARIELFLLSRGCKAWADSQIEPYLKHLQSSALSIRRWDLSRESFAQLLSSVPIEPQTGSSVLSKTCKTTDVMQSRPK